MDSKLPTNTSGVLIQKDGTIEYGNIPLKKITDDSVLLKVHSGIINPSDVFFLAGLYPAPKTRPNSCGFEGSGVVLGICFSYIIFRGRKKFQASFEQKSWIYEYETKR